MKDKIIRIRADEEFQKKLEFLRYLNGWRTISETIRKIIEKEYRRENGNG